MDNKTSQQIDKTMREVLDCAVKNDVAGLNTLMNQTMSHVKTRKLTGNKSSVKNACFIVRLAHHAGIKHDLISAYYAGESGINANNDKTSLGQITVALIGKVCSSANDYKGLIDYAVDYVESFNAKPAKSNAGTMPTINFGVPSIDEDEDFEDEEEEQATVTEESKFVLDEFNLEVVQSIKAVSSEEIAQAKEVLYNTNKNGEGYEMTLSGKKTLNAKNVSNARSWNNQLIKASADILCIAPKRQKKWTSSDGTNYNNRTWFPELCGAKKQQVAKRLTEQMTAYVILNSGRNFWNSRFAWSVSDNFRESWRAYININEEVANSKVIGGKAHNWHWPLVKNDWTPASSNRMTDEEYDNLDITSLDTL